MGGGMGGGMGGAPPMDMGGGMGGAPPMDMGGGMGGAPPAAGAPAVASGDDDINLIKTSQIHQLSQAQQMQSDPSSDFRIFKRGRQPKNKNQEGKQKVTPIFLTKPEQKLYNIIINLQLPYRIIAQYKQPIPGQNNPYLLDFAIPDLGLNLEADGDFWHSDPESIQRDKQRDYRLASMGWRIIRLREDALNNKADVVETIIRNNIQEIINEKTRRKANIDNNELIMKISSNEMKDDIVIIKNTLGYDQISSEED